MCVILPELLCVAVLFVSFGVEALQNLQQNLLDLRLWRASRRRWCSVQVSMFHLHHIDVITAPISLI